MQRQAVKILAGIGDVVGRLLMYDALAIIRNSRWPGPGLPLCGDKPTITDLKLIEWGCTVSDTPDYYKNWPLRPTPTSSLRRRAYAD